MYIIVFLLAYFYCCKFKRAQHVVCRNLVDGLWHITVQCDAIAVVAVSFLMLVS